MHKPVSSTARKSEWNWPASLLAILTSLVLLLVLAGAVYCWEYGDDYLNKVGMAGINPLQYSWELYLSHDGRHMSPAGIIQMSFVKYLTAPPAVFIYVLLLVLSGSMILTMVINDLTQGVIKVNLPIRLAFSAIVCIGLWPLFKDVLYWLTGGYYLLSLLQAVLLASVCFRYCEHRKTYDMIRKSGIALLVFLLSLNSQNIMLPVAACMGAWLLYTLYKLRRIDFDFILVIVLPAFIAMLVTNLAPGNFARLHREQPGNTDLSAISYLETIVLMYARFFNYSKIGIIGGLAFGFFIAPLYTEHTSVDGKRSKRLYVKRIIQCIALAVISMMPFMLAPALARIRVYFYGLLFLVIAGVYAGIYIRQFQQLNVKRFSVAPLAGFMLYGVVFFFGQLKVMIPFSRQVAERKAYLETQRGNPERVQYPLLKLPEHLHLIRWADAKLYGDWNKTKEYFNLGGYSEVEPDGNIIPGDIPPPVKP